MSSDYRKKGIYLQAGRPPLVGSSHARSHYTGAAYATLMVRTFLRGSGLHVQFIGYGGRLERPAR